MPNKYGGEYEVTCHTEAGLAKRNWGTRTGQMVGVGNHWAFTTAEAEAAPAAAPPTREPTGGGERLVMRKARRAPLPLWRTRSFCKRVGDHHQR